MAPETGGGWECMHPMALPAHNCDVGGLSEGGGETNKNKLAKTTIGHYEALAPPQEWRHRRVAVARPWVVRRRRHTRRSIDWFLLLVKACGGGRDESQKTKQERWDLQVGGAILCSRRWDRVWQHVRRRSVRRVDRSRWLARRPALTQHWWVKVGMSASVFTATKRRGWST